MLISEVRGWHWAITFGTIPGREFIHNAWSLDVSGANKNPDTKTTVLLAPRRRVGWRRIREAIVNNLHPQSGNAFYVNLRSRGAFERGSNTNFLWKKVR